MTYPIYKTQKGTPITAYVAEAIGKVFSIDGGEGNFRGRDGVIGSYVKADDAIKAAKSAKSETCTVRVTDTRANKVIFEA